VVALYIVEILISKPTLPLARNEVVLTELPPALILKLNYPIRIALSVPLRVDAVWDDELLVTL
jgi:hypothetical protein